MLVAQNDPKASAGGGTRTPKEADSTALRSAGLRVLRVAGFTSLRLAGLKAELVAGLIGIHRRLDLTCSRGTDNINSAD